MSVKQRMLNCLLFGLTMVMAALVVYQAVGQPPPKTEAPPSLNEILQAGRQASIDSERAGRTLLEQLGNSKNNGQRTGGLRPHFGEAALSTCHPQAPRTDR